MRDGAGSRRAATSNGVCLMVRLARMLLQMWRKHVLRTARATDKLNAFRKAKTVLQGRKGLQRDELCMQTRHQGSVSRHLLEQPLFFKLGRSLNSALARRQSCIPVSSHCTCPSQGCGETGRRMQALAWHKRKAQVGECRRTRLEPRGPRSCSS